MALLAVAMVPASPDGTNAMVMGLPEEPSWPAAGADGASASRVQTGGGVVAVGAFVAVAVGAAVGATVAGTDVGGGTAVGGTGAGVGVAAVPHAARSMVDATSNVRNKYSFFISSSSNGNDWNWLSV